MRTVIPLRRRKLDLLIIAFFILNLGFITYIVDIEQIIIPDPYHFDYPVWPPRPFVDMVHHYGETIDPVLMGAWASEATDQSRIVNEDSLAFELDDSNLFQIGRASCRERV